MSNVEVNVRSQLEKIVADLEKVQEKAKTVANSMKQAGTELGDTMKHGTDKGKSALEELGFKGMKVSEFIKGALQTAFGVMSGIELAGFADKLGHFMAKPISDSMDLANAIAKFNTELGYSPIAISAVTEKLQMMLRAAKIPESSMTNLIPILAHKFPGMPTESMGNLAVLQGQLGMKEGIPQDQWAQIGENIATTIQNLGGKPGDINQQNRMAQLILASHGADPVKTSKQLVDASMALQGSTKEVQKRIGVLPDISTAERYLGAGSLDFLRDYLKSTRFTGMVPKAMGVDNLITPEGRLDFKKLDTLITTLKNRFGERGVQEAAGTLGLTDASKIQVLIRNQANLKDAAIEASQPMPDLASSFDDARTAGEMFSNFLQDLSHTFLNVGGYIAGSETMRNARDPNVNLDAGRHIEHMDKLDELIQATKKKNSSGGLMQGGPQ